MTSTNTSIWATWTNNQDIAEFIEFFTDQGLASISEMCEQYVDTCIADRIFGSETPDLSDGERAEVASELADYLTQRVHIVAVAEDAQAQGMVLRAGEYMIHCPADYDLDAIGGEDIICDGQIIIIHE